MLNIKFARQRTLLHSFYIKIKFKVIRIFHKRSHGQFYFSNRFNNKILKNIRYSLYQSRIADNMVDLEENAHLLAMQCPRTIIT